MFLDPISQSALQVYYTGLPFTPSSTLVGKTFQRELRGAVTILSGQWDQWDASIRAISLTGSIQSIAFSPDGKLLASASDCEGVQLWNAVTGVNVANLDPGEKPSCAVRFSPSGAYVAVGCGDGSVTMWDSLTGQVIINDDEHDEPIKSVIFSHNSAILASASRTYIQLRDVSQGCSSHRVPLEGTVLSFAFSFDDRLLVAGCDDAMAIIWDLGLATPRRRLKGHNAAINCVAVSDDNTLLASGSDDRTVRIWDIRTGVCLRTYSGHDNPIIAIECVKFSPDGARIACGNGEGILKIWNVASSKAILTIAPPSPFVLSSIAFSPDGSKIVGGTSEGHVKLWDTSNGQSITNLDGHGSRIRYLVFTPDASRIIYYHEDNSIHVWSPPSTFAHSLTSNNATLSALEMLVCSDTDGTITCRSEDGSISVWTLPKDIKSVDHIGSDEASKGSFCEMCYHQPDSQTANPHLISQSETGNVYDKLLRSAYVFREDGWIYDGTRRLFWLPSAFRPISPSSMVAYQEKLWIEIATEKILVLDISE
ncbi:WD40-repeat-containing domain protein [Hygrophoropsis aurantiaca]|uniref:WD40-repeat-containing domain protein n=1 Tax=Hygrophoropsis aurantiaca TaxID=72124 RepID=A0ACB8ANF3_9AGAM|nr:WD40-repeat-containing domain protein [Hygrophoropsis aurantiaca]